VAGHGAGGGIEDVGLTLGGAIPGVTVDEVRDAAHA
jgi:hypothetical protein